MQVKTGFWACERTSGAWEFVAGRIDEPPEIDSQRVNYGLFKTLTDALQFKLRCEKRRAEAAL